MNNIYFDNAATTSLNSNVQIKMIECFKQCYGNASSIHSLGRAANKIICKSRQTIAECLNCNPQQIYFTSGGSQSDNWAIKGIAFANKSKGNHIITSTIQHHAILHSCQWLQKNGFQITYIPVNSEGFVNPKDIQRAIRPTTILISIMTANNQIGTIQPIKQIAEISHRYNIPFHTDAVQAVGHIPINIKDIGCDMLSLSAHKFNGPKGIGVLYIKNGTNIDTLIHGGGQERGRRASTQNVPAIAGMAQAIKIVTQNIKDMQSVRQLRDELINRLCCIPEISLNGSIQNRLPGNCNICIDGIDNDRMLINLDAAGICASGGSACSSGSSDPSYVLMAIGLTNKQAHCSIRLSIDKNNTKQEVDFVVQKIKNIIREANNNEQSLCV